MRDDARSHGATYEYDAFNQMWKDRWLQENLDRSHGECHPLHKQISATEMKSKETASRAGTLKALLDLPRDLRLIEDQLSSFPWDSEEELVDLTYDHLRRALQGFVVGLLPAEYLEDWANLIESREDIRYQDALVGDLIHELANPSIMGELSCEAAEAHLAKFPI